MILLSAPGTTWTREGQLGFCGFPATNVPITSAQHQPLLRKPGANADTTFYIRKDIHDRSGNPGFVEVEFTRVAVTEQIDFYVETSEWESERVTQTTIEQIRRAMLEETPENSINPDKGIYENEVDLFGPPPDVDNNGKIFVLLVDVRDNYDEEDGGSFVGGYFDQADQTGYSGNRSDILYIDTNPGMKSGNYDYTMSFVAHELQHLLHYAADKDEETWVNEGMSEVTAHLFNYPARSFSSFLNKPTRRLDLFEQSIRDYAKVGLWTYYLYNQHGEHLLREVVQNPENGIPGFESVLNSRGLPDFTRTFRNWVVANLSHSYVPAALSPTELRYRLSGVPTPQSALTISRFPAIEQRAQIQVRSASYIRLIGGTDLSFQVFPPQGFSLDAALLLSDGDSYHLQEWRELTGGEKMQIAEYEDYDQGYLILYSAESSVDSSAYTVTLDGESGEVVETVDYTGRDSNFFLRLSSGDQSGAAATQYSFPSGKSRILQAEIKLYNNTPVTYMLRESLTGKTLTRHHEENPGSGWNTWRLDTLDVRLTDCVLILSTVENAVALDTLDPSGNSYFRPPSQSNFYNLSQTDFNGDWKMRIQISYPDTGTGGEEFQWKEWQKNPVVMSQRQQGGRIYTTLDIPERQHIRIDVFNILGQHVKTIADAPLGPRSETVEWDGTDTNGARVSSGLYIFRVQTREDMRVRKLTVIW